MSPSVELAKKPSSTLMGWGMVLTIVSAVIFGIAFPMSFDLDSSWTPAVLSLLSGAAFLAGLILMAVAVTRVLAKIDDAHRHFVARSS